MKLSRRRPSAVEAAAAPAPVEEPVEEPEVAPPPPDAKPPGAPEAVFAGVLDGRRLWIAVPAEPGRLALRSSGPSGGEVVDLVDEAADDQPGYLGARLDLAGLPGTGPAGYDVVVVPPAGREPRHVWTPPLPDVGDPSTTAGDGVTAFRLDRGDAGFLRVRRSTVRGGPTLLSCRVDGDGDGVELVVGGAPGLPGFDGTQIALVHDGDVVAACDATTEESDVGPVVRGVLTGVPADAPPQLCFVVVGAPGAWTRIRRRDNDLADARRGVPLPRLEDPETGEPRLRLRWSAAGVLQARVLAVGEGDE